MSRELLLTMTEQKARDACAKHAVAISVIESLVSGGVRLVCTSREGADTLRGKFSSSLIKGEVVRTRIRPLYR